MAHAVFMTARKSPYKDLAGKAYHFPRRYLGAVERALGDWVVLYEPQTSGKRGYYAFQRLGRIVSDPEAAGHYFAQFDETIPFDRLLPRLRPDRKPYESNLPNRGGNNFASVRPISPTDFADMFSAAILRPNQDRIRPRLGL